MIGGHSDVTLGLVCGNDPDLLPQMNAAVSIWGLASNPFDCWLAERGLATLDLRQSSDQHEAVVLLGEHPHRGGQTERVEARHAGFRDGRHIGEFRPALGA